MKKANLIIAALSIYIVAAFAWWTYAHYKNTKTIYNCHVNEVELTCYKATYDLEGAKNEEFFNDTNDAKKYLANKYPKLEILFLDEIDPLGNFMIRPSLTTYNFLKESYGRQLNMYIAEGVVMMLLLFFGIIHFYKIFQNSLFVKRQQSNFLLSITHELKTPIASIKLYVETLKKRKLDEEQTQTILNNTLSDTNRLQNLAENLLLSAQINNKKYELIKEQIDLSAFLENSINKYIQPRQLQNSLTYSIEPNINALVDPNAIEMLLLNLLNNAVKYAGNDPKINVTLTNKNNQIALQVADNGPGISDKEKKEIFNIFYRIGDENTRKTKGTGLGLYIVSNIAKLHNASIEVLDNKPVGTVFLIKFNNYAA